jgi:hypothetical protein
MTRRKALTVAVSVTSVFGLIFALMLFSHPVPAASHAGYTWKPGCHCGKPTPTTVKPTTPTTKKVTTTTAKPTTTTAKPATATTAKPANKGAATTAGKTPTTKTAASATKKSKPSTTTTTAGAKSTNKKAKTKLAIGAVAAAALGDSDDGGPPDGAGGSPVSAAMVGPPHYYLSPVAIVFIIIYGVSFALYRTRRMRVTTHRRIWNVLLLATFLMCGVVGLVLAVGVTREIPWEAPAWLLVWHVETGIVMCFISFFHIGWHLRYYMAVVSGKRRAGSSERRPAAGKAGAGRPQESLPRVGSPSAGSLQTGLTYSTRGDAERLLAFEKRQATRAQTDAERWLKEAKNRMPRGGVSLPADPLAD